MWSWEERFGAIWGWELAFVGGDEIAQQHSGPGSNNQDPGHVSHGPNEPPDEEGKTNIGMYSLGQDGSRI